VTVAAKLGQFTAAEGKSNFSEKIEGIWQKRSCEKDFISKQYSGYALSLQWPGLVGWEHE